jgi:hypothetical protein
METEIQRDSTQITPMGTQTFRSMDRRKLVMEALQTKEHMSKRMMTTRQATQSLKLLARKQEMGVPRPLATTDKEISMSKKRNLWTTIVKSRRKRSYFHYMKMRVMIKMSMEGQEEMRTA